MSKASRSNRSLGHRYLHSATIYEEFLDCTDGEIATMTQPDSFLVLYKRPLACDCTSTRSRYTGCSPLWPREVELAELSKLAWVDRSLGNASLLISSLPDFWDLFNFSLIAAVYCRTRSTHYPALEHREDISA
jgi:hypothetical protein